MATKKRVPPKTLAEFESGVNTDVQELEVSTGAPDDLVFEDGPRAGERVSARQLEKDERGVETATPSTKKDVVVTPGAGQPDQAAAATEVIQPKTTVAEPTETTVEPVVKGEPAADDAAKPVVETYQPNYAYKVYDQEKQFPDWAKPLATSKEVEDNLRTTIQKSEAFEALKPKHENVVKERDTARSHVQEHVEKVTRMQKLRDDDLPLFLRNMGVSPKALIDHAAKMAHLQDTDPQAYAQYMSDIEVRANHRQQADDLVVSQQQVAQSAHDSHQQAMSFTLSLPDVSQFRTKMDATYGSGSFDAALANYGTTVFNAQQGRYLPPLEGAKWVMEQWGKSLPPVAAVPPPAAVAPVQTTSAPVQPENGSPAPKAAAPRLKTLPNVGRGTAASPVRARPKSFADLDKIIAEG